MKKTLIGLIVIIGLALAGLGVWALVKDDKPTNNPSSAVPAPGSTTPETQVKDQVPTDEKTVPATIKFDGTNFSPETIEVGSGVKLTIVNNSDQALDFQSDPHPVHTDNDQLNIGLIAAGQSKTVSLTTVGEWGYHNHLNPNQTGTITVR